MFGNNNTNGLKWRRPSTWNDIKYLEFVYYCLSCGLLIQSPNKMLNSSKLIYWLWTEKSRKICCYLKPPQIVIETRSTYFAIIYKHDLTLFTAYLFLILTCLLNFRSLKKPLGRDRFETKRLAKMKEVVISKCFCLECDDVLDYALDWSYKLVFIWTHQNSYF